MERFEAFMELIRTAGYEGSKYSGRGMFGRYCVAIRPQSQYENSFRVLFKLGRAFQELPKEMQKELEDIQDYMDSTKADSVGHHSLIYFPAIEWKEVPKEDDGDQP